jgi:hypothetical protein
MVLIEPGTPTNRDIELSEYALCTIIGCLFIRVGIKGVDVLADVTILSENRLPSVTSVKSVQSSLDVMNNAFL